MSTAWSALFHKPELCPLFLLSTEEYFYNVIHETLAQFFSYDMSKYLCSKLGGEMAIETDQNFQFSIGNPINCQNKEARYWAPIILKGHTSNDKYEWLDDRPKASQTNSLDLQWAKTQPNGQGLQKCVGGIELSGEYKYNDWFCNKELCSVCRIPGL